MVVADIDLDTKGDTSEDGNLKTEDILPLAKEQKQVTVNNHRAIAEGYSVDNLEIVYK